MLVALLLRCKLAFPAPSRHDNGDFVPVRAAGCPRGVAAAAQLAMGCALRFAALPGVWGPAGETHNLVRLWADVRSVSDVAAAAENVIVLATQTAT